MNIVWFRDKNELLIYGDRGEEQKRYFADCIVRNEVNRQRELHNKKEVVYSIPEYRYDSGYPYMPRRFPKGNWKIIGIEYTGQKYLQPVKILTDASQLVPIWTLDKRGGYDKATGKQVMDTCYWIHYWRGRTTLGCIRVAGLLDILNFAEVISPYLGVFKEIPLEVL